MEQPLQPRNLRALTSGADRGRMRNLGTRHYQVIGNRCGWVSSCLRGSLALGLLGAALFAVVRHFNPAPLSLQDDTLGVDEVLKISTESPKADDTNDTNANDTDASKVQDTSTTNSTAGGGNASNSAGKEHYPIKPKASWMSSQAVRLRWSQFPSHCLDTWSPDGNTSEYKLSIWSCFPQDDAWWKQRFLLPPPGDVGEIRSEIGNSLPGRPAFCLTVHNCAIGTPLVFRQCQEPDRHTRFQIEQKGSGKVKIMTPKCPPNLCLDIPDTNTTSGNFAQVWHCSTKRKSKNEKYVVDESFNIGLSMMDEEAFDNMVLSSEDTEEECAPMPFPKKASMRAYQVRCPLDAQGAPLALSLNFSTEVEARFSPYTTLWALMCSGSSCSCKSHEPGRFESLDRSKISTSCGATMISTRPADAECPPELTAIEQNMTKGGKVDCNIGKKATEALAESLDSKHNLMLRWVQVFIFGLSAGDLKAFSALEMKNSSGICNCSEVPKEEGSSLDVVRASCPAGKKGGKLGLEVAQPKGGDNKLQGASLWSLWCAEDACACTPVKPGLELFSRTMEEGEEGCGVMMLTTYSSYGNCPQDLAALQKRIEGDDEVDCAAGKEMAEEFAADPKFRPIMKLKWVEFAREVSALASITKSALNFFSIIGGVVVVGTVPAWPAVAKFVQFQVMLASNHAELGMPDQFTSFARKFTKFDEMVKPIKKNLKVPVLKDIGKQFSFGLSSKWFILKDKLLTKTMHMVLRVLNESGMISPGAACFLANYYDPLRENLRNISEVLEASGGEDQCIYDDSMMIDVDARRLASTGEEDLDESLLMPSDGGIEVGRIRKRWEDFQASFQKQIKFIRDRISQSKKDFSITKSLLFCLMIVPFMVACYIVVYAVLWIMGHRLSFIPHLRPNFFLVFIMELVLLNTLMAWANVLWRRKLLQVENPFRLLNDALGSFEGIDINEPLTSAMMAVVRCFKPIIALFALWDGLHINLEKSKMVANAIFILGPCLTILCWTINYFCLKLGRHPNTNRFMDQECGHIKAVAPVVGTSLKKQLFYETPEAAKISKVIAAGADGTVLYSDGQLQTKGTAAAAAKDIQVVYDEEVAKAMSDGSARYSWGYRLKGFKVGIHGLPDTMTLALDDTGEFNVKVDPDLRLRMARGNRLVIVAFKARPRDSSRPLPTKAPVSPGASEQARAGAERRNYQVELLKSAWRRRFLAKLGEMLAKDKIAEAGLLQWTMWDSQESPDDSGHWILVGCNVALNRRPGVGDDEYRDHAADISGQVKKGLKVWGEELLNSAWTEVSSALVDEKQAASKSISGQVEDGPVWLKLSERRAKAGLTAEEAEMAIFDFDDVPDVFVSKKDQQQSSSPEGNGKGNEDPEAPNVSNKVASNAETSHGRSGASGGPANDPKRCLANITVTTALEDEQVEKFQKVKVKKVPKDDKGGPIRITVISDLLKKARHGDIIEVWFAGVEAAASNASDGEPLINRDWQTLLKAAAAADPPAPAHVRLLADEIKPWEDPGNPYGELVVLRAAQERSQNWLKALRKFPEAFVGQVQVPIQLLEGYDCDLNIKVGARDLPRLNEAVPLKVPFEHLQLKTRDTWRVFYSNDHKKKSSENPQFVKILNALNIFFMVFAVVMIPRTLSVPKESDVGGWEAACREARGSASSCNAKSPELREMTEQAERSQEVADGLSWALIALITIVIIRVVLNAWTDGDLKFEWATLESMRGAIQAEWIGFRRLFKSEKRIILEVQNAHFTKVKEDIDIEEAFSRTIKNAISGVKPEEITLEINPCKEEAVKIYASTKKLPDGNVKVEGLKYDGEVTEFEGCDIGHDGNPLGQLLTKHAGNKSTGWAAAFKAALEQGRETLRTTGIMSNTDDAIQKVCAFSGPSYAELTDEAQKEALKNRVRDRLEGVTSVELACVTLSVTVSVPQGTSANPADVEEHLNDEKELSKVRTGKKFTVSKSQRSFHGQHWPSWMNFNFAMNLLKFILIVLVAGISLASGAPLWKTLMAFFMGLLLWFISRLIFKHLAEGSLFKSSTMEVGQVGVLLLPVLCQSEALESTTASCMMIIGVLWAITALCCLYLRDTLKKYEKQLEEFIREQTKRLASATSWEVRFRQIRNLDFDFTPLVNVFKRFKVLIMHRFGIYRHAWGANSRDPVWLWNCLLGLLCFACVVAVSELQGLALTALGNGVLGSERGKVSAMEEVPWLLGIFAVSLLLLALAFFVFMTWLPTKLQDRRLVGSSHKDTARDVVQAMWPTKESGGKSASSMEDEDTQDEKRLVRMLNERARAYRSKDSKTKEDYKSLAVTEPPVRGERMLFDPLGGLAVVSSVQVFADDGGSILEGALVLRGSQLPMKRLLCSARAWEAPRYLVERTPVQVGLQSLACLSQGAASGESAAHVPQVGVKLGREGRLDGKALVASIQVVSFVGLVLGKTDYHDGVLSLWKSPQLGPKEQLVFWFNKVLQFFRQYGASFEMDSRVYVLLEGLFWGVKDAGSKQKLAPGQHLREHKGGYMERNSGKAYDPWVERNMRDLVKRLGPNRAAPGQEELSDVSSDEQKEREIKEGVQVPVKPNKKKEKKSGVLHLNILDFKNMPEKGVFSLELAAGKNQHDCKLSHVGDKTYIIDNFRPGETTLTFKVHTPQAQEARRAQGEARIQLSTKDCGDGKAFTKEEDIDLNVPPCCGCPPSPQQFSVTVKFSGRLEMEPDKEEPVEPKRKFKRQPGAEGFCGGPLTWQLLYPSTAPELLHVAVVAEDLRAGVGKPDDKLFAAPPILGSACSEPPLREQRVLKSARGEHEQGEDGEGL